MDRRPTPHPGRLLVAAALTAALTLGALPAIGAQRVAVEATATPEAATTVEPTAAEAAPAQVIIIPSIIIPLPTATRTPTPVSIGNFVWEDIDQDGRQDAGEPGIGGVVVQLWNSAKTQLIDTTVTNASGGYTLVAPRFGDYRVRVVLPSINDSFAPKDNAAAGDLADSDINPAGTSLGFTDIISIASNVISTSIIDAGIIVYRPPTPTRTPTPVNIGNFVWEDIDQDGRQDAGEPGIGGVVVQLWNSAKNQLIDTTVTNASGSYTLVAPRSGDYRVRVVLPSINDLFTVKDAAGGNDQLDSDINPTGADVGFTNIISIASNVISTSIIDAGIIVYRPPTPTRTPTPINIGNFVWEDLDSDGVQDAGEPGVANITVQLWNSAKTLLIGTAVTNASGGYALIAPVPGNYRVRVVLPGGASFTIKDSAAASDTADSDINPSGLSLGFTDTISIASNVISITSIDAGLLNVPDSIPSPTATTTLTPTATSVVAAPTLPALHVPLVTR